MSPDDWKVHILPSIIVAGSVAAVAVAVLAVARSGEEVAAAITETNDTLRAPAAVFIKTAPEMTRSLSKIAGTLGRLKKAGIKGKIGWFPVR